MPLSFWRTASLSSGRTASLSFRKTASLNLDVPGSLWFPFHHLCSHCIPTLVLSFVLAVLVFLRLLRDVQYASTHSFSCHVTPCSAQRHPSTKIYSGRQLHGEGAICPLVGRLLPQKDASRHRWLTVRHSTLLTKPQTKLTTRYPMKY